MSNSKFLWEQVENCFCEDDGSLPGIEITNLSPHGVSEIYAMLRSRSRLCDSLPANFWSRTQNASIHVDSVPNAAALVANGNAECLHHCVCEMESAGVKLPVLGIGVFPDSIELDYRMGSDWGPEQVLGFFELLKDCCNFDSQATVIPAKVEGPPFPEHFIQAWAWYRNS